MTPKRRRFYLYAILLALAACSDDRSVSISAEVPSGWRYVSNTAVAPNKHHIQFSSGALNRALERGQASPLFALTRGPDQGARATVGITAGRLPADHDGSATDALQQMLDGASGQLRIIDPIRRMQINGYDAAQAALSAAGDQELLITIIFAGDFMFTVAGSVPDTDQSQAFRQEIEAFTRGLKISPARRISPP